MATFYHFLNINVYLEIIKLSRALFSSSRMGTRITAIRFLKSFFRGHLCPWLPLDTLLCDEVTPFKWLNQMTVQVFPLCPAPARCLCSPHPSQPDPCGLWPPDSHPRASSCLQPTEAPAGDGRMMPGCFIPSSLPCRASGQQGQCLPP